MRVTQGNGQAQFLTAINALESSIAQSQSNISSNQSFTTASQNPVAAGSVNNYTQALAQSQQFTTNSNSAQTNLNVEDNALSQVQTQLNSLRSLALEATNGTLSQSDRSAIATQAVQIQNSILSLANTQNGNGEYIFSGYAATTQPFSLTATGATYQGNSGQRQVQIAPGQSIPDGDTGDAVFNQIPNGNGTFTVAANPVNTGSGLIGASTVTDASAYDGGTYDINFTAPGTYEVRDSANNLVTSGTYTDGTTIAFKGLSVALTGTPSAGDSFTVAPSTNQSVFATVQNLVTALQTPTPSPASITSVTNQIEGSINDIDQSLNQVSNVRTMVGGRLNAITATQSIATGQQTQLTKSISSLQGLDYASAITALDQQNTTLSAALQAFTMTQGLSLFKFLQ
jgi:flagellar hook-associated protein 3 FlgL